jgi:hypothetical protein
MKVSITQFRALAVDANGNVMPLGRDRIACEVRTAVGAFAALNADAEFIRVATDTAMQMDITGGATDATDELFPANSVEFLAVHGGEVLTIA